MRWVELRLLGCLAMTLGVAGIGHAQEELAQPGERSSGDSTWIDCDPAAGEPCLTRRFGPFDEPLKAVVYPAGWPWSAMGVGWYGGYYGSPGIAGPYPAAPAYLGLYRPWLYGPYPFYRGGWYGWSWQRYGWYNPWWTAWYPGGYPIGAWNGWYPMPYPALAPQVPFNGCFYW
jgi:hypothetical protein